MPDVSGVPGGSSPNQIGQFYVPPSEWNPNPLDEDLSTPLSNPVIIRSLFLAAGFLVPWAGSYDEVVTPVPYEEDSWVPIPLVSNTSISLLVGGTNPSTPTPVIAEEEYQYNRPIIWPPQVITLTWRGDEELVSTQGSDGDEWQPKLPPPSVSSKLTLWDQDELALATFSGDEGELLPRALVKPQVSSLLQWDQSELTSIPDEPLWLQLPQSKTAWQSVVVLDSGEWLGSIIDEESWVPTPLVTNTTLSLLVGTSAPTVGALTPTEESEYLRLKYSESWRPRLASDPTDDVVPVLRTQEEDYWIPIPPVTATTLAILAGTATKAEIVTQVGPLDEVYQVPLSRNKDNWRARSISDPFDDNVPSVIIVEDEAKLLVMPPPVRVDIVAPWVFGEDDYNPVVFEDEIPASPLALSIWKPLPLVTPWRVGESEDITVAFGIDDDFQLTVIVPPPVISLVAPWEVGNEELVAPALNEPEVALSQLIQWSYSKLVTPWRAGENEDIATALNVQDEEWQPKLVPPVKLIGQGRWLTEQGDLATIVLARDEDYQWYTRCITPARLERVDQWKFEQHDIFVQVTPPPPPPPKCDTDTPSGVVITVDGPSGTVITIESPSGPVVSRETPTVITLTKETPAVIGTSGEPPTDPCL